MFGVDLDLVAALEPFLDDLQVQFTHPGDHRLLGLGVQIAAEGRILFDQLLQRAGELGLVTATLGGDGQADLFVRSPVGLTLLRGQSDRSFVPGQFSRIAADVLDAVGREIIHVGEEPGTGQTVKAALQALIGAIFAVSP